MVKKNKYFIILLFSIFFSFSLKIFFLDNFYSETDDRLVQQQILKYKNESIYSISNDKLSPSYQSEIKKKIRAIQKENNLYFNFVEKITSSILISASPSKHSTYAPMQFLLFSHLVTEGQNYEQIKFYSRLPSVFFSILYVLVTYFFVNKIFGRENKFSLIAVLLLITSLPLLYISLRSYNYAAGIFSTTLIFYLTYLEMIKKSFKKIKLSENKVNIKNSLYLALILSFLTYTNYSAFYILPIFFIICFLKHLKIKNLFSYMNINLFITGSFLIIFSSPLIFHIIDMKLYGYGVSASTAGELMEYHLSSDEKNNKSYITFFYLENFYLTVSRNLSFFTEEFLAAQYIHFILFLFVLIGIFISRKENYNIKMFSNLFVFFLIYYFLLIYFEILTLGPSKHNNFYTPIFSILFIITLRFIYNFLRPRYSKILFNSFVLIVCLIFFISFIDFYKKYYDVFNEDYFNKIIKNYDVAYISTNARHSDQLCLMKSIKVLIRTCPIRYNRYLSIKNLNEIDIKKIKKNNQSVMFVNDKTNFLKYKRLLEDENFHLIQTINNTKFGYLNSPLYISKYKPNLFEIYIFK